MYHTAIQAITAAVKGYCAIHGMASSQCGAAKQAGGLLVLGLGAASLITVLAAKD